MFTEFSRQGGLAADGRCKPFSADADGTGWGEGAGLLVVERLSDAVRNGRRILGVVAGSAVNQDGASNGLTAPNGPSQERVIRAALADARISAGDVDVVEAHGTGTVLGDPIEAGALLATYGQDRPEGHPVWLGSVKSNIGHAQAAAGVAGVIKVLMALRHQRMPATLHADARSPHVDWDSGQVSLLTAARDWPRQEGRVRRAGVSAFGVSGTNAHVILEEPPGPGSAPGPEPAAGPEPVSAPGAEAEPAAGLAPACGPGVGRGVLGGVVAWPVSAKTPSALAGQAARLAGWLRDRPGLAEAEVAAGLAARGVLAYRAVVTGTGRDGLLAGLDAVAAGEPAAGLVTGAGPAGGKPKVVFVFPGQGGQWPGMGAGLWECCPAFREQVLACDEAFGPLLGWRVSGVLRGLAGAPALERPDVVQPALFTMMVSLAAAWRASGVVPGAVAGHSQGEIAAAFVAGVLSLADAAAVVAARGRVLAGLAGGGAMASVRMPAGEAGPLVARWGGRLTVAAVNSPVSVVVSGEPAAVGELIGACAVEEVSARLLAVDYASHSVQVEGARGDLAAALAGIVPGPGSVPFYSGLAGGRLDGTVLDGGYWYDSLRGQVRFDEVVRALAADGHGVFVEVSPHPVLTVPVTEVLEDGGQPGAVTGTLCRDDGGPERFAQAAAAAWAAGLPVDWQALTGPAPRAELPGYAFERQRYWLDSGAGGRGLTGAGLDAAGGHPLLAAMVELPDGGAVVTGRISLAAQPWLADHVVHGTVILPGAAFAELAWHAGMLAGCPVIEDLTLLVPLVLPASGGVQVQVLVGAADEAGRRSLTVSARIAGLGGPWVRHAEAVAGRGQVRGPAQAGEWPPAGAVPVPVAEGYERLAELGYRHGPAFRAVRAAWRLGAEVFAELSLEEAAPAGFAIYPVLLDAALQSIGLADGGGLGAGEGELLVPFAWAGLVLAPGAAGVLRVVVAPAGADAVSVTVTDAAGVVAARAEQVRFRPVTREQVAGAGAGSDGGLLALEWVPVQVPPGAGGSAGVEVAEVAVADGEVPVVVREVCGRVLGAVQGCLAGGSRLAVVTRGAVAAVPGEAAVGGAAGLAGAAAWGLVRSAQAEEPGRLVLIDTDGTPESAAALPGAIASGELQVALRAGQVLVPRLCRAAAGEGVLVPPAGSSAWRLVVAGQGTLEGLALADDPQALAPLGPGQVRVGVRAAGLNFRYVIVALGMNPGLGTRIGDEGAGTVIETGPGVTTLTPGDRVMGLLPGGMMGLIAVADHRMLVKIPAGWSFAQAAGVPVVFLTAYYGLADLARLRPGESVLVHAGAGGVGMAAIQLARQLGAEVFATASPAKWPVLRSLGVADDHIASSRSAGFEDAFRAVTGGRGVDVVLNSLTGELADASLRLLADGGRFMDIGRADIRDPQQVARDHPGTAYRAFDLAEAGIERIGEMLGELMALFAAGALRLLPVTAWDIRRAPEAFRFISQARHTGKVVLTMPPRLGDGPVLVTGGTGTLGGVVARHLVAKHGAGELVLASRRGPGAPGAGVLAADLAGRGATVRIAACDTADKEALAGLITGSGPLAGVVHCAGVLRDTTAAALTTEQLEQVLAPKADGAWHLHELTAGMDLGMFALFSSAAGTLGNPGQANYAAANAFLDALAARRRALGQAGVSLAWGFWEQISELTGEMGQADLARLRRAGSVPLTSAEGMELFDAGVAGPDPAVVAAGFDTAALAAQARAGTLLAVLRGMVREPGAAPPGRGGGAGLAGRLAGLDGDGQQRVLLEIVRAQAAAVLGHGGLDGVAADRAFRDLGFDSLTAVELRNRLTAATGLRLPTTLVFDYPTPAVLAAHLLARVLPDQAPARPAVAPAAAVGGTEPVAVVGIGCRFPGGAGSAQELWDLVAGSVDAVGEFPADRGWDAGVGSYARRGGFVYGAAEFDAGFFGISPREAVAMDPQQRLLLECAWQAFEDAGIDPATLRETSTGVFAGVISQDYGLQLRDGDAGDAGGFGGTGSMASVASGRLSYAFGLEGPAVSVDTACSSSLVALHLACQSLRRGECSLALAGGVTVMSTPVAFAEFSRQGGLAADGRCKPFSADADGTGWGEGAGLLVVERLSDAVRNGRRILGVVAGSAVNQDGASNGLTAPNGPSQERVIRAALADARISAGDVDVVEAHGTGTVLGDPIEAGALLATYGQDRPEGHPVWLGSVKSNIGHAQAAAGVAGVIKVLMALRHQRMPATLHADARSPHVDWDSGQVSLLTAARDWPRQDGRVRRAGVSSFGVSGTNAHVILEEPPQPGSAPGPEPASGRGAEEARDVLGGVVAWPVSAKTPLALAGQAARLAGWLRDRPELDPATVAAGLAARPVFAHRAVVTGAGRDGLLAGLGAVAAGEPLAGVVTGQAVAEPGKVAFVFPGQGSQQPGAGAELHAASPVFAASVEEVCELFGGLLERPLREVMFAAPGSGLAGLLDQTCYAQAGIFAVEVALARVLDQLGIRPALAAGHSVGEITAAYVAGVLTLQDAVRLVAARGRLMQALPPGGAMTAVQAGEEEVAALLAGREDQVVVAAVNGPASVVISGREAVVAQVAGQLAARGRRTRQLRVSHAFHSPLMEPMLGEFAAEAARVAYAVPRIPLAAGVSGQLAAGTEMCCAQYWVDNVRRAVRFGEAVLALRAAGAGIVAEVGPGQVLSGIARECLDEDGRIVAGPALRRGRPEPEALAALAAEVFVRGGRVDWPVRPVPRAELPGYAFERQRYWLAPGPGRGAGAAGLDDAGGHPLLGGVLDLPDGSMAVTGRISLAAQPWLADHVVHGTVILPGAAFAELAWHAGMLAGCPVIEDLTLLVPLVLPASGGVQVQVLVGAADEAGRRSLTVSARAAGTGGEWVRHVAGTAGPGGPSRQLPPAGQWPPSGAVSVPLEHGYERLAGAGYEHGPAFRAVRALWRRGDEVFTELAADEEIFSQGAATGGGFAVHPVLLDAALQSIGMVGGTSSGAGEGELLVPFAWAGLVLAPGAAGVLRVVVAPAGADAVSVTVTDAAGVVAARAEQVRFRPVTREQVAGAGAGSDGGLLALEWVPVQVPPGAGDSGAPVVVEVSAEHAGDVPAMMREACASTLRTVQEWLESAVVSQQQLAIVTRGAVAALPGDAVAAGTGGLAGAAVWGLVRSAQSEEPGRFVLIDTDGSAEPARVLAAAASGEPQVAIRGGQVLVPRLRYARAGTVLSPPAGSSAWRLVVAGQGTLEGLALADERQALAPLGPGQVRVGVRAAGLNFRDVVVALGMNPGLGTRIGDEGAGTVIETGPGVTALVPGDRVMGTFSGMGPVAVADHRMLVKIPAGWSFAQAAGVPVVFLTAYYGLADLARLRPGESVLVHAGAGGVGMAAIQLARQLGAEVFATASPAKWPVLRSLGVADDHIASSRSAGFEDAFRAVTGGRGVDVVLNSLTGELADASLRLLADGGRFMEMGKADIRDPQQVARDHPGTAYRAFDLGEAEPERIGEMLGELMALFAAGALRLLPVTAWDIRRAPEAFRFISQARHTGKVVLTMPPRLGDGPVLVTGGTGTLGGVVARHLVAKHGAGELVLASRRGPGAPGAGVLAADLAGRGATVRIAACDTADKEALAGLITGSGPLAGVVHCAGVLDDGTVGSLTARRFDAVLAPKADGAWHLHELTAGMDLGMFALFSSAAGTLGNPGQANYAAANAFLDALAARRRALGQAGVSLAWGFWEQISELTGEMGQADLARLRRAGSVPLTSAEGMELFDAGVAGPDPAVVAAGFDTAALAAQARAGTLLAVLRGMVREPGAAPPGRGGGAGLAGRLAGLDGDGQQRVLLEIVRAQAAAVLGHGGLDGVAADRAFRDLGFDSLTAVELRNRLTAATGLRLPTTLVFDYPTPAVLAAHLLARVLPDQAPARPAVAPAAAVGGTEPVAVVGIGCRFPGGAGSAQELWDLVAGSVDAVGEFPADRGWDAGVGSYARRGGFVYGATEFDAGFFGISPREAVAMDPQQRLLLECAWQAFEDAGIDPATLRETSTGVFAGVISQDYGLQLRDGDAGDAGGFGGTGSMASVASGRLSYAFGLEGPAVSVDTACSSSLVALHLACQSLRRGECSLALAGGVTVMATPGIFAEFSRQGGLAADGRCKPFSADADGTGWGEGAGLLVVERLSDAVRNGRRILGVVAGSAVNQDGASNGLTAPNGPSQERVIRAALADARISAGDVDVVEAHGTGTVLGDPIEAGALLATYGQDRPEGHPVWLGSVKSNIGHAQAAAGVAGVIKVLMALRHQRMPATLHADARSPHVDWDSGQVSLLTAARDWPRQDGRVRRAGVSSFGVSGTNAHVILEEPPQPGSAPGPEPASGRGAEEARDVLGGVVAWPVSAKTPSALAGQAARLAGWLRDRPELDPATVAAGLAARPVFAHRAVVTGAGRDGLLAGLGAVAAGEPLAGVVTGQAVAEPGKVAFVFPGQGSQQPGAGAELHAASPVFAASVEEVCELFGGLLERPLREVMFAAPGSGLAGLLDQTCYAQAGIFAVEVALARVLDQLGIRPALAAGHSVGEITAAYVAGVLTLQDAVRLVAARGRLMQALPPGGAMTAVQAGEEEVAALLAGREDQVVVAAVNGPASVVISGREAVVAQVAGQLAARGRRTRQLRVSHAFHSPLMEPMLGEFAAEAARVAYAVPRIPLAAGVSGQLAAGTEMCCAQYWVDNVRRAVRFGEAVLALRAAGAGIVAEVGPGQVLSGIARECLDEDGRIVAGPALRRGRPEPEALAALAAEVFVRGGRVDWPVRPVPRAELPGYAFERQRYWLAPGPGRGAGAAGLDDAGGHPLLGGVLDLPDGSMAVTGRISLAAQPWLADHVVHGTVILPGAAFAELAWHAGMLAGCPVIEDLTLLVPLVLPASGGVQVQVLVGAADEAGRRSLTVSARIAGLGGPWVRHAEAVAGRGQVRGPAQAGEWPPAGAVPVPVAEGYERLAELGYRHGPAFRAVRAAWRLGAEVFAELSLEEAAPAGFAIYPVLLDAALQSIGLADGGGLGAGEGELLVPFAWAGLVLAPGAAGVLRVVVAPAGADAVSVTVTDAAGVVAARAEQVRFRPVTREQVAGAGAGSDGGLLALEWVPVQVPPGAGGSAGVEVAEVAVADGEVPVVVREVCGRVLGAVQGCLAGGSRLAVVTRGAVAAVPGEAAVGGAAGLAGAAAWGLVRSAQAEEPGRLVLIDTDGTPESAAALPGAIASGELQVALRAGQVLVPRLCRAAAGGMPPRPVGPSIPWSGPVLVTGGTGTLGGIVARHLASGHGAGELVLASRRGPGAPGAAALAADLAGRGAAVRVTACDAADRDALAAVLAQAQRRGPLAGVVHCAGVTDDGAIASLSPARLEPVLAAKADAAWHLHELTAGMDLAVFALFSSASGIFGGPGQGNYAAANAFLDALAARRRAQGLPGVSLAWGLWEPASAMTAGMSRAGRARAARSGMRALTARDGLALFDAALAADQPLLVPLRLDAAALRAPGGAVPALLARMVGARTREATTAASPAGLTTRLAGLDHGQAVQVLTGLVTGHAATILGYRSAVEPDLAFRDLGIDSLTAVELRNQLSAATGLRLPATLVFDYPSPRLLAAYLLSRLSPDADSLPRPDDEEAEIRKALATIPLSRLRAAGVMELLAELAGVADSSVPDAFSEDDAIDDMDTETLINMALIESEGYSNG